MLRLQKHRNIMTLINGRFLVKKITKFSKALVSILIIGVLWSLSTHSVSAIVGTVSRISLSSVGGDPNGASGSPSMSEDNRFIVYYSNATNIVNGSTNVGHIYMYDRQTGTTTRISNHSNGSQGNAISSSPGISFDGNVIVYESNANNLIDVDTNGLSDIFVWDKISGTTSRVSVKTDGSQANSLSGDPVISGNGRYVVFTSYATNLGSCGGLAISIFMRDLLTSATTCISLNSTEIEANGDSSTSSISSDGDFVVFETESTNLDANDLNGVYDIYLRDVVFGNTLPVSVSSDETFGNGESLNPQISANGRYVVFQSDATNLVPNDTNGKTDVFIRDLQNGTTARVSISSADLQGNSSSTSPSISSDGRYVAFRSAASNLVSGDTNAKWDVFVRDMLLLTTVRVSVNSNGTQAAFGDSGSAFMAPNGRYLLFNSYAGNLVDGDSNSSPDIFFADSEPSPFVSSITRIDPDNSNSSSVNFAVSFSEEVTGIDPTGNNFLLTTTGDITGASIVNVSGSGSAYNVTVNRGTGSGTIRLDMVNSSGVSDAGGNALIGLPYTGGSFYTFDDAPYVSNITMLDSNPSDSTIVDFSVVFSESIVGISPSDFSLTTTGITGASVSSVSGSGSTYTVSVSTGTGNGTLRLDIPSSATIADTYGNSLSNLPFTSGEVYSILRDQTFGDVTTTYWAWQYIERLYNAGITGGCTTSPLSYCPANLVTRAQMAIFLEKGIHGSSFTPPDVASTFTDTAGHWAEDWIETLKNDGITSGCGTGIYCPDSSVTRAQMAVFLLKSKHGSSYTPPSATGVFSDVATTYWAAAWIEQLAVEGVTSGCASGLYCPDNSVTRDQMAVFLVKAFNLP